jgi:hypothetical protein
MITAEDLAGEFGVSGKTLRSWLRRNRAHVPGQPWLFTSEEAAAVRRDYPATGSTPTPRRSRPASAQRVAVSDEAYVIDLCEQVLGEPASRQHRFDWLRGDPTESGRRARLPVDAYFPGRKSVVEYRERQHYEAAPHFDKPDRMTVSGVHRGEQRRRYDQRRETEIPRYGLRLTVLRYDQFDVDHRGRLRRTRDHDVRVIGLELSEDW